MYDGMGKTFEVLDAKKQCQSYDVMKAHPRQAC